MAFDRRNTDRMRADVPVGSYLSGGLDSSIVSALASKMAPGALQTFSIGFASKEHDESEFQSQMAAALGTHHRTINCGSDDIATIFPKVVEATERPIIRTAPAPLFLLSRLVRDHDMKVVLTGEGADEVFAGYDIFKESRIRRFCARNSQSKFRAHLFRKLYPYLPGVQQQSAQYLAAFFRAGNDRPDDPLYSHRPRFRGTAATKAFRAICARGSVIMMQRRNLQPFFRQSSSAGIRCIRRSTWRAVSCCPAIFSAARAIEWQWRTVSRDGSPSSTTVLSSSQASFPQR